MNGKTTGNIQVLALHGFSLQSIADFVGVSYYEVKNFLYRHTSIRVNDYRRMETRTAKTVRSQALGQQRRTG